MIVERKSGFSRWYHKCLKERYEKKMIYYKKIADYNLYRHNEAVDNYNQKKQNRNSALRAADKLSEAMGFRIADERADYYAQQYNEYWDLYIKFKQKLEVLEGNSTNQTE